MADDLFEQLQDLPLLKGFTRILQECVANELKFHEEMCSATVRSSFKILRQRFEDVIAPEQEINRLLLRKSALAFREISSERSAPQSVTLRALAVAWDASLYHQIYQQLAEEGDGTVELGLNQVIPAARLRFNEEAFKDPLFNPLSYDDYVGRTDNFRFVSERLPMRVIYDYRFEPSLRSLLPVAKQNFAVANFGPVDFDNFDKQYNVSVNADDATFCEVHPKDSLLHIFGAMIEAAEDHDASVLVFPELSLHASEMKDIRDLLNGREWRSLKLIVAGSHHTKSSDVPPQNQLVAFLRNKNSKPHHELTHHKISRFVWKRSGSDEAGEMRAAVLSEGIHCPQLLRVFVAKGVPFVFLICKDFLQQRVLDCLRILGIRFVFVSSLSPETCEFETHASALTILNNCVTVIANSGPYEHPGAIFGALRRHQRTVTTRALESGSITLLRIAEEDPDLRLEQSPVNPCGAIVQMQAEEVERTKTTWR